MLHLLLLQHELVLHVSILLGAIAIGFELGHGFTMLLDYLLMLLLLNDLLCTDLW